MDKNFGSVPELEITDVVASAFAQDSITEPTPVQRATFAPILAGRHVVIHSGTGTGKTLAYLLPLLQRLKHDPAGRAAIFAPSAELAMQTLRVANRYKDPGITTGALVGSGAVTRSTRLIVGTPGRILELYAQRKLKGITTIVLDEPDPIVAGPHAAFLREVLSRPEPKVQLIVAAATLGPVTEQLVQDVMGEDGLRPEVDHDPLHTSIAHRFVVVGKDAAAELCVAQFVKDNRCKRAIVFVNQDPLIRHLYRYFDERGLQPVSLFSERSRTQRKEAVAAFTASRARVLITNDAAARGLDVPNVEWVLHYELPRSAQAYLHRAGRTGRAGESGHSVVFLADDQRGLLKHYAKELGLEFQPFDRAGG